MRATDAPAGPVNLGNPAEITMRELAQLVIGMTGSHRPSPCVRCRSTTPGSAAPTSPWRGPPRLEAGDSLKEGLSTTIAYFMNEMWLDPIAEKQLA
jgi:UDP-glucuronate decarboxylase